MQVKSYLFFLVSGVLLFFSLIGLLTPAFSQGQGPATISENCRLFGTVTSTPGNNEYCSEYLVKFQYPLAPQYNGWSIATYSEYARGGLLGIPGQPMIVRSNLPIEDDHEVFTSMATLALRLKPQVILAHLRTASSGCNAIADPHPFVKERNGKWYVFQHNGGVWGNDLNVLINKLVGTYALPENCPDTPIDSEYLFLFFLKILDVTGYNETDALALWAQTIKTHLRNQWNSINAIVSDGTTVWAVKCRKTLYSFSLYLWSSPQLDTHVVSTDPLGDDWASMHEDTVYCFRPMHHPEWRSIDIPPLTMKQLELWQYK